MLGETPTVRDWARHASGTRPERSKKRKPPNPMNKRYTAGKFWLLDDVDAIAETRGSSRLVNVRVFQADLTDNETGHVHKYGAIKVMISDGKGYARTRTFIGETRHSEAEIWLNDCGVWDRVI